MRGGGENQEAQEEERPVDPLRPIRLRGSVPIWSLTGIVLSLLGCAALTGLSASPWLFLLYPALIGVLLVSLVLLALHLIHRF